MMKSVPHREIEFQCILLHHVHLNKFMFIVYGEKNKYVGMFMIKRQYPSTYIVSGKQKHWFRT